jgi:hypothetical protein
MAAVDVAASAVVTSMCSRSDGVSFKLVVGQRLRYRCQSRGRLQFPFYRLVPVDGSISLTAALSGLGERIWMT